MFVLLIGVQARAEVTPAQIDLWVEVNGGGTAVIAADAQSPLPDQTTLELASGEVKAFHLTFDRVGEYSYSVALEADGEGQVQDDTVYLVGVYVTDEDGVLLANVVIMRSGETGKYVPEQTDEAHPLKVVFRNTKGSGEVTPPEPATPSGPNGSGGSTKPAGGSGQGERGSAPKTGDVSIPAWIPGVLFVCALAILLVARKLAQKSADADGRG